MARVVVEDTDVYTLRTAGRHADVAFVAGTAGGDVVAVGVTDWLGARNAKDMDNLKSSSNLL